MLKKSKIETILIRLFYLATYISEYIFYRFFCPRKKTNFKYVHNTFLLSSARDTNCLSKIYCQLFPNAIQEKIDQANLVCDHIFDLLGSSPRNLSQKGDRYRPINWHSDFKSGHNWNPKTFYRSIRYGHKKGVDIKVPWELSRFQHLNILGQAYLLTKRKIYVDEFSNQILDWINNNPLGFGVNWKSTMDVAIRAANWLVAQEYFAEPYLLQENFWRSFYTSIYEHGKFIYCHFDNRSPRRNNHYIAELVGLLFISIYCPFFKESEKWKDLAIKELSIEIERQVYPDGCSFEASTLYHRLVLELFFYGELLARRKGIEFPHRYKTRVRKMFDFTLYSVKPDGFIPQIGDNDSGRFLVFCKRPILDHKYLVSFAAIYYRESKFKVDKFAFDEEAFWIFGERGKDSFDNIQFRGKPLGTRIFPFAGWYIIRDGSDYCFISCGPNGQNGNGGHAHNDKLSFELMLNKQNIFVDPGTYAYTSDSIERNKFRSTGYHNTVNFIGYEQNTYKEKELFLLPDRVIIKKAEINKSKCAIAFHGKIQYADAVHERKIIYDLETKYWEIRDNFSSLMAVGGELLFHLSPDLAISGNVLLKKLTGDKIASVEVAKANLEEKEYDYSYEYGRKAKAICIVSKMNAKIKDQEVRTYIRKL